MGGLNSKVLGWHWFKYGFAVLFVLGDGKGNKGKGQGQELCNSRESRLNRRFWVRRNKLCSILQLGSMGDD